VSTGHPSSSRFSDRPLHELFEAVAARTPDRVAAVCDDHALSYRELNERANRLAHRLRAMGAGPETLVGLHLERSLDLVVAILGVLKAGAAYLPLDLDSPPERLSRVLSDAAPVAVIVHVHLRDRLGDGTPGLVAVDPEGSWFDDEPATNPCGGGTINSLAYVIYTSGSTGAPKGVLVEHRAVINLLRASECVYQFSEDDVWTLFHSAAFDFSVWELWGALLYGARLVVVPRQTARAADDFHALCLDQRVTVLNQTPSAFHAFMEADLATPAGATTLALRYVIFGGEALSTPVLRPWLQVHGDERPQLFNMYGITETTVHVTARRITLSDLGTDAESRSLIGVPIPGYVVRLLKPGSVENVAVGVAGEMAVGGAGLARGYLNRPEVTAERFVGDPLDSDPGARLYRSGDLGRLLPNGELEYLGRIDGQVKIRGFRVETGEIEAVLCGHALVAQCAVVMRDDATRNRRLVAYWTRRSGAAGSTGDLRAFAAHQLPGYMIPSAFVELPCMPLTVNGKIDRHALSLAEPIPTNAGVPYAAPSEATEAHLAAAWAEAFGLDRVGVHDNFFDLGGHSLLAARIASSLRSHLGVRVPISAVLEQPTIALLAAHLRTLESVSPDGEVDVVPGLGDRSQRSPMSFPQRALWFAEQLTGNRSAYLLPEAWRLRGALDEQALERALTTIVARHAPLRTHFDLEDGEPVQIVDAPAPIHMARSDLRALAGVAQEAEVARLVADEAERPFNLQADLLLRARLVALGARDHVLLLTVHHIASDAWSRQILLRELEGLYRSYRRGESATLDALPVEYEDFARRQRAGMTRRREADLIEYWRRQLARAEHLRLPTDGPRPLDASDRGRTLGFAIDQPLFDRLQRLAAANRATLQILLASAYQVLLARYSGQEDISVATFAAGRDSDDVAGLVGIFVNQIVLHTDLSGRPTFRDCLQRARAVSLGAYDHQDLPFETVVAELQPDRRLSENPLARVAFQYLPFEDRAPILDGLDAACIPAAGGRSRFDIEMTVSPASGGLRGALVYRTDLFTHEAIERFAQNFLALLAAAASAPDAPVDTLAPITPVERDRQLRQWSGIESEPAEIACVHVRFAVQAARTPDATAVSFGAASLTYRQLDESATRLAHQLSELGAGPNQVIALHLDRSVELIVAMLGVLKTGAAYLPLDPTYPVERLAFMLRDQQVEILICDESVPASLSAAVARVLLVRTLLDGPSSAAPSRVADAGGVEPSDLAYVMYTSGSTGEPKGVGIPHRAVTRLVRHTNYIRIDTSDRIAQASNASFDAATFEIWGALLNGAHLIGVNRSDLLSPSRLSETIRDRGITVMFLPAALFHEVAAVVPAACAPLRCLIVGGDVLDAAAVRAVLAAGPPRRLLNGYGPTENTTFSTWFEVPPTFDGAASVPIGRPLASSTCYVLDANQALLPVGAAGELYVGGAGLAAGYMRRPELTADRFVAHPFVPGERLYRTGDRARWRGDGALEFLGRVDRQIKVRGHRVEIGEIEHALSTQEGVASSAVELQEVRPGQHHLVAYWVARGDTPPAPETLRAHLRCRLPDYMMPVAFVEMASWPLTVNGKLDRTALPLPDVMDVAPPSGDVDAPASSLETTIADIFRTILQLERVDRRASFFDLGGTSLGVFRMVDQIKQRIARDVAAADVFFHPSVAGLASHLDSAAARSSPTRVVEIRRGGSKPPLYFPPEILGQTLVSDAILEALPEDQPIYGFSQSVSADLVPSLAAMADGLCSALCAFQPEGPLSLAGYSFAGLLAYEMARQLTQRGRQIAVLAVFDTGPDQLAEQTALEPIAVCVRFLENLPRWVAEDLVRTFDRTTPARLGRSVRRLLRRITRATVPQQPGETHDRVEHLFDTSQWPPGLYEHVQNNLRILEAFSYGPYTGSMVILRARVRPLFNSHTRDLGWRALVSSVRVVNVPGNHHTMMIAPHNRVLAQSLRKVLVD
jgi:amino acid adenylation domain-containing protein